MRDLGSLPPFAVHTVARDESHFAICHLCCQNWPSFSLQMAERKLFEHVKFAHQIDLKLSKKNTVMQGVR